MTAPDGMPDHYARALEEIDRLRTALAYEARVIQVHLDYRSFPKTRRPVAERQVERMTASARGQAQAAYADTSDLALAHVRRETGIGVLTRSQWEKGDGL
jgi:hypothetical protein